MLFPSCRLRQVSRPCPFPGKCQTSLPEGGQLLTRGRTARGQDQEPSSRQHIRAKHVTALPSRPSESLGGGGTGTTLCPLTELRVAKRQAQSHTAWERWRWDWGIEGTP